MPSHESLTQGGLFQLFFLYLFRYKAIQIIVGFLMMLTQALFFNYLIAQLNVLPKKTYLPAFFYLLVVGLFPQNLYINPVFISMNFLMPALYLFFQILSSKNDLRNLFYASVFLAIASFFYFNVAYYLIFFWIVLIFLGNISLRKWITTILGFITPYAYLVLYYFWNDKLIFFVNTQFEPNFSLIDFSKLTFHWDIFSLFLILTLILIFSTYRFIRMQMSFKVIQRKLFSLFGYYFFITIISLFFASEINYHHFVLFSVPVALFMAFYFMGLKRKWVADVLLLIVFAAMLMVRINYYT